MNSIEGKLAIAPRSQSVGLAGLGLLLVLGCSDGATSGGSGGGGAEAGADVPTGDGIGGDVGGSDEGGSDPGDSTVGDDKVGDGIGQDSSGGEIPDPFDDPSLVVVLDRQIVQLASGNSPPVGFDIPEGVYSLSITVEGQRDEYYTLNHWVDGAGVTMVPNGWVTAGDPTICFACKNRLASSEGVFATLAPNQPESQAAAGTHVMKAYGYRIEGSFFSQKVVPSNAQVAITVKAKMLPAAPEAGVLDLNLYFTGAQGWNAATAPENDDLQNVLTRVNEIYAQAGIKLGRITYRDVDPIFQVIESVQGPNNDLMELFSQSTDESGLALNVFFVNELNLGGPLSGFGVLLGVAGGIPGPPLMAGTAKSGVAIAIKPVPNVPAGLDTTTAHEIGHFLGLFHTSEQDFGGFVPQVHDPLPDTPNNDKNYLMFNSGEGDLLSPWQGKVMRASLWVRHDQGGAQ